MISHEPQTPPGSITEAEAEGRLTSDRFYILALIAKADHRREDGDMRAANAIITRQSEPLQRARRPSHLSLLKSNGPLVPCNGWPTYSGINRWIH